MTAVTRPRTLEGMDPTQLALLALLLGAAIGGIVSAIVMTSLRTRDRVRAETVATSPAFRASFRARRCIVPSDGFFEWRRAGSVKQPYFLHPPTGAVLAMAGMWAVWKDPTTGLWVPSAAVITTAANRLVGTIHDRMPVLLPREAWDDWLDRGVDDEAYLLSLLEPAPDDVLEMTPISTKVNDVRNQGPELLEPVTLPDVPGARAPADEETPTLGLVS